MGCVIAIVLHHHGCCVAHGCVTTQRCARFCITISRQICYSAGREQSYFVHSNFMNPWILQNMYICYVLLLFIFKAGLSHLLLHEYFNFIVVQRNREYGWRSARSLKKTKKKKEEQQNKSSLGPVAAPLLLYHYRTIIFCYGCSPNCIC